MHRTILLGHGSGGIMTGDLIREVFMKNFNNPSLLAMTDSSILEAGNETLAFTTDSYVVDPLFFPGGNIGNLAVCGTVNDLSVSGARPLFISAAFIIEEGLSMDTLEEIAAAMSREAIRSGVQIVTGDTKVVKRGQCDKLFINTAGIGLLEKKLADISGGVLINPGDQLLVNGYLGDHEMAILSARENITFEEPVVSDVVPLNHMIRAMLDAGVEIHFMRDITRGGLATILAELVSNHAFGVIVEELNLPIREQVTGLCELYGFNPLYLANEGKILAVVSAGTSTLALEVMQSFPEGEQARIIGNITASNSGKALIKSTIGGIRVLEKLAGEQLPRIC